eukprot:1268467-Prymnesium_polylepis.1
MRAEGLMTAPGAPTSRTTLARMAAIKDKGFGGVGAVGELELCRQAARRVGADQVEGLSLIHI